MNPRINLGTPDIPMPHQHLDRANVSTVLQKMGREAMPQGLERDLFLKAEVRPVDAADPALQSVLGDGLAFLVYPKISAAGRSTLQIGSQDRGGVESEGNGSPVVVLASSDDDRERAEVQVVEFQSIDLSGSETTPVGGLKERQIHQAFVLVPRA